MKRKNLLKISIFMICSLFCFNLSYHTDAADLEVDGFNIMPKLTEGEVGEVNAKIERIGSEGGQVWKHYNDEANQLKTNQQIASGIMNRNTIVNYLVFIIRFLSELGLLVGAAFIMVAGYKYMTSAFSGAGTSKASGALKSAVIGVLIVIFSYAFMRILTSFIGLA